MGACLECLKKKGGGDGDNEVELSTATNQAVTCKRGLVGKDIKITENATRKSYLLEGAGTMLGSCTLDCDTAFWEVIVGKNPQGVKIGVRRYNAKKPTQITGELDNKAENAWYLEGANLVEGDVIGICWDQTDLPMLSFTHNGNMMTSGAITRIRPSNDLWPAVSLQQGSTCEVIFDGDGFVKKPPSSKFSMIVCATSLI
eukprot:gene3620-7201_t